MRRKVGKRLFCLLHFLALCCVERKLWHWIVEGIFNPKFRNFEIRLFALYSDEIEASPSRRHSGRACSHKCVHHGTSLRSNELQQVIHELHRLYTWPVIATEGRPVQRPPAFSSTAHLFFREVFDAQLYLGFIRLLIIKDRLGHLDSGDSFLHSKPRVSVLFPMSLICLFQQWLHEQANHLVSGFNAAMMRIINSLTGW